MTKTFATPPLALLDALFPGCGWAVPVMGRALVKLVAAGKRSAATVAGHASNAELPGQLLQRCAALNCKIAASVFCPHFKISRGLLHEDPSDL